MIPALSWLARLAIAVGLAFMLARQAGQISETTRETRAVTVDYAQPYTVETTDPRLCMHTRTTDEVDEPKILQTFELVRELGASQVVEYLPWAYVERQQGVYDWSHPDRILKHIEFQGLDPIIRLGFVPPWARPPDTNANFITEGGYDAYAAFVGAFVERYTGRVDKIIIWNEPNLNIEWTNGGANPQEYTELLRRAYIAAHAANPDIMVLGGALAPTLEVPQGAGGWNELDFLNEMYLAGAAPYFDALAAHVYGFDQPPQAEPAADTLNFRRIELLREVMLHHDDGDKPVYVTEGGWNDHPRWVYGVRPGQRIAYTLDAYAYIGENYPWMQALCLWAFRYPAPSNSYPDYFTFLSAEFDPKPIYTALQAYGRGWETPAWLQNP